MQHDRSVCWLVSQPHRPSWELSASVAGSKWLYCPVLYGDHRGRGALGMTCKPNTSPHSICCLINLISSSFSTPLRQPSPQGTETETDREWQSDLLKRVLKMFSFSSWGKLRGYESVKKSAPNVFSYCENMFFKIKKKNKGIGCLLTSITL